MGKERSRPHEPVMVRDVLAAIVGKEGFSLATWPAFGQVVGCDGWSEGTDDTDQDGGVACPVCAPGMPANAFCLFCGRIAGDVRTLGCGGTDRKGRCLARTL